LVACGGAESKPPVTANPTPETKVVPEANPSPLSAPNLPSLPLLRVDGARIVDSSGVPVRLTGVAFGNEVWGNVPVPSGHHSEADFERLANMGMNSVRFYLNYRTFEDDSAPGKYKQSGWDWLEKNIAWARRHGVYLVLNMHAPAGGYQSLGKGVALWSEPAMQARFIALWRAIAERYAGEGAIAGYDILNEPVPSQTKAQWHELAERTVKAIREVDTQHIVFVERVNAVNGDWSEDADNNFFRVEDPNVVYEFHFYKPFHFTHQSAFWTDLAAKEGKYPDDSVAEVEWYLLDYGKQAKSKKLPEGDSDWAYYQGESFTVNDAALVVGKPVLACDSNAGKAWFDGIVLERVGRGGKAEKLWERDLDTRRGWYFWTQDGSGASEVSGEGHGDTTALTISGTKGNANLSADPLRFRLEKGKTYRLSGWMKGQGISKNAACTIRLDFASSKVPVHARGKDYLRQALDAYVAWGKRENVPLYLGEFGTIRGSFDGDYGGLRWVTDMLDLVDEHQLSYAYHAYHEQNFGIFFGDGSLPDTKNANTALLELLTQKARAKATTPSTAPGQAPAAPATPTAAAVPATPTAAAAPAAR
jgi:endoglucanase